MTMLLNDFLDITPPDPLFSSVIALLHMDGTVGGTTFTDDSSFHHTIGVAGDAKIASAQAKFGQSLVLDGNGDYLTLDSADLALTFSDEFTLEGWIYPTLITGGNRIFSFGSSSNYRDIYLDTNAFNYNLSYHDTVRGASLGQVLLNQWSHVMLGRTNSGGGSYMTVALNGTPQYNVAFAGGISGQLSIGTHITNRAANTTDKFVGYMDDIRFTKGNRYGFGSFTPPTAPYSNH